MNIPIPAKPYQLFFEHYPDYLYAYIGCSEISLDIAKRYWTEILAMLRHRRYKRILIEKNISERLPAQDVFELVSELAHSGCGSIAFAIVDQCYDRERAAFEESVGSNGGLNVKLFDNTADAEKWLLSIDTHKLLYVQAAALAMSGI